MSHALEVKSLSRRFGGLKAVDGLSFRLSAGSILGLLGPNGSGKTTALNLIAGVLRPDAGSIHLAGVETTGEPAFRVARRGISRTFQLVRLFDDMTVRENVIAGLSFAGPRLFGVRAQERTDELLTEVGLAQRATARASDLTYIDRKRLELARALGMNPKVLLLDEWLAGLNPTELKDAVELVRRVRDSGVSILMVEHVIEAVRSLCNHCVIMNAGAMITEGKPHEALNHPEVIRAYLGDDYAGS
jgi:branched-chain amino acid transport system ATP-binding protein